MALKFEVDTLDSVDEAQRGLYAEHNGKFRLSVEGLDPADEVKGALAKEREERKKAKTEAEELRKALEAKELAELEGQKKYEELYKREQETRSKTSAELQQLKDAIAQREKSEAALKVAASLTRDTAKAELLKKEILNYTEHSADGVKFKGESGDMTAEQLTAHLTKQYPFLVDGNQSSGGGANGGNGGGAAKGNLGGDKTERKNAIAAMFPDLNK